MLHTVRDPVTLLMRDCKSSITVTPCEPAPLRASRDSSETSATPQDPLCGSFQQHSRAPPARGSPQGRVGSEVRRPRGLKAPVSLGLGHPVFAEGCGLGSAGSGLINPSGRRLGGGHLREEGGLFGDPCARCLTVGVRPAALWPQGGAVPVGRLVGSACG